MPIPQPDLAAFIAKYARPYDTSTDTYRRPPFASPIKAGKANSVYNIHRYHTKVPPQGIEPYIRHYTESNDLILDPFCGSGMTGVAAVNLHRSVILNDLSPAAAHIAYNYSTPVDVQLLKREFERINIAIKDEFDWLYGTTCDRCNSPATIVYMIWSDVLECGRCGGEITLWDVAVEGTTGIVKDEFACPHCRKQQSKQRLNWIKSIPVLTSCECSHCKPSRGEHPTTDAEKKRITEIDAKEIPYWYPTTPFDQSWEMWRAVHGKQGITDVSRFYTRRNLWALARLWHECQKAGSSEIATKLKFAFTGVSQGLTKRSQYRPGETSYPISFQSGTLYIPSLMKEYNVLMAFKNKLLLRVTKLPAPKDATIFVNTGSATNLALPNDIIDYIFTDPPFGSNIFYADMNLLWESWLGLFTDQTYEAVVHVKHKDKNTLTDYARLMTDAFREMHRVLKPGRWASVVFHNSDDKIWNLILQAAQTAGFELADINSFDKEQLSFKGIRGDKGLERVTNKDIVLNLHKPAPNTTRIANGASAARNGDAEVRIVQRIADHLAKSPPTDERTLQHFWNVVLHEMLVNGLVEVSMEHVGNMLPYYFKEVDGRWYLRGEAVLGGNAFDLKTDAGAIAWLSAVLTTPRAVGELIPQWQAETAQVGDAGPGRLERLLEQNFWQDKKTGHWRHPTADEREKMTATQDIAAEAHLRVIRRFLAGQSDHHPSDRELAEWVRFAYIHQAPAEAVALYAHVNESHLEPDYVKELRKIISVCRMKVGQVGKE